MPNVVQLEKYRLPCEGTSGHICILAEDYLDCIDWHEKICAVLAAPFSCWDAGKSGGFQVFPQVNLLEYKNVEEYCPENWINIVLSFLVLDLFLNKSLYFYLHNLCNTFLNTLFLSLYQDLINNTHCGDYIHSMSDV